MKHIKELFEGMFDNDFDVAREDIYKDVLRECLGDKCKYTIEGDTLNIHQNDAGHEIIYIFNIDKLREIGLNRIHSHDDTTISDWTHSGKSISNIDIVVDGDLMFDCNVDIILDGCKIQCDNLKIGSTSNIRVDIKKSRLNVKQRIILSTDRFKFQASNRINCPTLKYVCSERLGNHEKLGELGLGSMSTEGSFKDFGKRMNKLSSQDPAKYYKIFCDIDPLKVLKLDKVKWPDLSKIVIMSSKYIDSHGYILWNHRKGIIPFSMGRMLDTSIEYEKYWYANAFSNIHFNE